MIGESMKFIRPKTTTVADATQYSMVKGKRYYQPNILLWLNKQDLEVRIKNRYVLYDFLQALNPEEDFNYLDMMHTIYSSDTEITGHSFADFLSYWLDTSTVKEIPVFIENGIIEAVVLNRSKSIYIDQNRVVIKSILDELDACDTGWGSKISTIHPRVSRYKYSKAPYLIFSCGNMQIEVLSLHTKTYIVGRYKVGDGWVQPKPYTLIKKWTHLMSLDELFDALTPYVNALKKINEGEIPTRNKFGDRALKLNFTDRNKL